MRLEDFHMTIEDRINSLETEVELLRAIVDELREKRRKTAAKEFSDLERLQEQKQNFLNTFPHKRAGDDFTNVELVFWASYILSQTNRREKLDSTAEVFKRAHKLQAVIDHFKHDFIERLELNDEDAEKAARVRTKDYLEMVLLSHPEFKTRDGMVPMTFYPAISDWAISQWGSQVGSWQQKRDIEDRPPEE